MDTSPFPCAQCNVAKLGHGTNISPLLSSRGGQKGPKGMLMNMCLVVDIREDQDRMKLSCVDDDTISGPATPERNMQGKVVFTIL